MVPLVGCIVCITPNRKILRQRAFPKHCHRMYKEERVENVPLELSFEDEKSGSCEEYISVSCVV